MDQEMANNVADWVAAGKGIGFYVSSIPDANRKLRGCTNCIKTLNIQGHGSPGYQDITPTWVRRKDFPDLASESVETDSRGVGVEDYMRQREMEKVFGLGLFASVRFCKPCRIVLRGCNVGLGKPGLRLMKAIHDATGCEVSAFTWSAYEGTDNGLFGTAPLGWVDWISGNGPQVHYPPLVRPPMQPIRTGY